MDWNAVIVTSGAVVVTSVPEVVKTFQIAGIVM